MVKDSTVWTPADAAAGATPRLIEQRVRDDPERHAERAVDDLGGKADADERQDVDKTGRYAIARSPDR